MLSLLNITKRPSERVCKVLAAPVAFTFIGLIIGCLGANQALKDQQAASDNLTLQAMMASAEPQLLAPPAILKGGR